MYIKMLFFCKEILLRVVPTEPTKSFTTSEKNILTGFN
jgi:hypothetical protein